MDPSAGINKGYKVAIGSAAFLAAARWMYPYFGHDFKSIRRVISIRKSVANWSESGRFAADLFLHSAAKHPYKPFIIFNNRIFTYKDIDMLSNKFANFVMEKGLKCGDTVAILMHNSPTVVWAWLALAKLGIKCALINVHLRKEALTHCLTISGAKLLVIGEGLDLVEAVADISDNLKAARMEVWSLENSNLQDIYADIEVVDEGVGNASTDPIPSEQRSSVTEGDASVYIYTSGTTGLPKAAIVSHYRHLLSCHVFSVFDMREDDIVYISLPLYHASAFALGIGNVIRLGTTAVLAPKFSVHSFWEDCRRHNVTVILYIGEICRYLTTMPENTNDRNHKVRMALGNGLRPDIWEKFQRRFNIGTIGEFFAATDGPFWASNHDNKVGAVGKLSPFMKKMMAFELVKYNYDTAEPIRDSRGRCIPVKHGDAGLLLATINDQSRYDGYHGRKDLTNKKIVSNAFKDGDKYFNTGDLLSLDKNYYLYFVDRVGDTFRWKGENVATTEVSQVLTSYPGVLEAVVYGVAVPGQDGRAGMAVLHLEDRTEFDFKKFYNFVISELPLYSCPRFLRIQESVATTGTYKYEKTKLVKEGFDPNLIEEPLYYMDSKKELYSPLDNNSYAGILVGKARL
ncbi:long-chain fatty acid transport protein 2-like [Glandiceps talaboti]